VRKGKGKGERKMEEREKEGEKRQWKKGTGVCGYVGMW
jgi:hypothetical protein